MSVSVRDAVTRLVTLDQPVLFCDTCALLDLIRIPNRTVSAIESKSILKSAFGIITAANANRVSIVIPPLIRMEWTNNVGQVEEEARKALNKLQTDYDTMRTIETMRGGTVPPSLIIDIDTQIIFLKRISEQLLNLGLELSEDHGAMGRAAGRASLSKPPGKKGGEVKDCIIYEHTLNVMAGVRSNGHRKAMVLLTSNTHDYCAPDPVTGTKDSVRTELSSVGSDLCTTWSWAVHSLGL